MTLTVGVTSYVTLAEADAYAGLAGWTAWAVDDAVKEAALRQGARYLDTSYSFKGAITSTAQPLAWPRSGVVDKEGRQLDEVIVPEIVKDAQVELAFIGLSQALVASSTSGEVSQITAGSVSITFKDGQSASETAKFAWIDRLLTGLHNGRAGGRMMNVKLARA